MDSMRHTQFDSVAGNSQSMGSATLRFPLISLWQQFRGRFLKRALDCVWTGRPIQDFENLLEDAELTDDGMSLDKWFESTIPLQPEFQWEPGCLAKLLERANDLLQDDGKWRDDAADFHGDKNGALTELTDTICKLVDRVWRQYGPLSAGGLLQNLDERFRAERKKLESVSKGLGSVLADELRFAIRRLQALQRPRALVWRLLRLLYPKLSPRLWLSSAQSKSLKRRLVPNINQAASARLEGELREVKFAVFDRIVGTTDCPGLLQKLHKAILKQRSVLSNLCDSLSDSPADLDTSAHEILLVRDIDTKIDRSSDRSVGDLWDGLIKHAGCSHHGFARYLISRGLRIDGTTYFPTAFQHVRPHRLLRALGKAADHYLGSQDMRARLDIKNPKTAFEFAATVTLAHPALRWRLETEIAELARQSRPYAEFEDVNGADARPYAYLYCYPPDRKAIEQPLLMHAAIVNRARPGQQECDAYRTKSPYVAVLTQYMLAAPGGTQRCLHRAMHISNIVRRSNVVPPLFKDVRSREIRLLCRRPDDHEDVQELFAASIKASIIVPLGDGARYHLATPDERLEDLFAPPTYSPKLQTASYFHKQLSKAAFLNFVRVACPSLRAWPKNAAELSQELCAGYVAERLKGIGVLREPTVGIYCLAMSPPEGSHIPEHLYDSCPGQLQGLTADEFVRELRNHDCLYNVVFWQTVDALGLGRLTPNDVPEFVNEYIRSLGVSEKRHRS